MRGTAADEPVVSKARTKEFEEGYERLFGDHPPIRGKWVYDESTQTLVPVENYVSPPRALDAPVMVGRFYENTQATDGTDIGSRARHKAYMHDNGLTTVDDYKQTWQKAAEHRAEAQQGHLPDPKRREVLERRFWEINEGRKAR